MPQGPYIPPSMPQGTSTLRGFGVSDTYGPRGGPSIPEPTLPGVNPTLDSGIAMPQGPYVPPEMPQGTSTLRGHGDYSGTNAGEDMPKPVVPKIVSKGKKGKKASTAEVSMPKVPFMPPDVPQGTSTLRGFGTPNIPPPGGPDIPEPVIPGTHGTPGAGIAMPQGPYVPPEMPMGTSTLRGYGDGTGSTPGEGMPQPSLHGLREGRGRDTPAASRGMPEGPFIPPDAAMGTSTLRGHGAGDLPPSGGPVIPEPNIPRFGTSGHAGSVGMPEAPYVPPDVPTGTSTLRGHGAGGTPSPHGPSIPSPSIPTFGGGVPGSIGMHEAPFIPQDAPTGASTLRGHGFGGTPSPHGPSIPSPNIPTFGGSTPGGGVSMPEAPFIPQDIPTGTSTLRGHGVGDTPSPHGPSIPSPSIPTFGGKNTFGGVSMPEAPFVPPEMPMGTSTLRGHGVSDAPSTHGPSIPEPHVSGRDTPTEPFIPPPFTGSLSGRAPSDSSGFGMPEVTVPHIVPSSGATGILKGGKKKYGNPLNNDKGISEPQSIFGNAAPVFPHSPAGSVRPLFPDAGPSWGTPAVGQASSLGGWGSGATPAMSNRDLPGTGERTGLSIYGPPSTFSPNPSAPISMPEVTVPVTMPQPTVPQIIEEDNGFDQTTLQNTKFNTMTSAAAKKKKKKK